MFDCMFWKNKNSDKWANEYGGLKNPKIKPREVSNLILTKFVHNVRISSSISGTSCQFSKKLFIAALRIQTVDLGTSFEGAEFNFARPGGAEHFRGATDRSVTRLDGARGKKQVWRPRVRTWGLSEGNSLQWRKYLWNYWDFSAPAADIWHPPQRFGATIIIRSQGNCAPLPPIVTLLATEQSL